MDVYEQLVEKCKWYSLPYPEWMERNEDALYKIVMLVEHLEMLIDNRDRHIEAAEKEIFRLKGRI